MARQTIRTNSHQIEISLKQGSLTIMCVPDSLFAFDRSGRLLGAYLDRVNYRRGMDNRFQARWRHGKRNPDQAELSDTEARRIVERARWILFSIKGAQELPNQGELHMTVNACLQYDWEKLVEDGLRFQEIFWKVPILPPDQYRALVVRITEGCSYNRCSFCTLYRSIPFRAVPGEELEAQLEQLLDFYGDGLSYRRSIFLGDANSLSMKTESLIERINILRRHPDLLRLVQGGIASFTDVFTGVRKTQAEYEKLRMLGLNRIALGIETGYPRLLKFVQKPGKNEEVIHLIEVLKTVGIDVTPIFMVGLGGKRFREPHRKESINLLKKLPLDRSDIVYLSQFMPDEGSLYDLSARASNVKPLSCQELTVETGQWKSRLRELWSGRGPKVVSYNFQRFIY